MNKIKKHLLAVMAVSGIVAAGLVAPQAMAAGSTEMELRILQMEETLRMMRDELNVVRSEKGQAGRFDALEERMGAVETADMPFGKVFFRSGFQNNNTDRTGEILVDAAWNTAGTSTFNGQSGNAEGWYFGAGIEHGLSRDLFGLMDDTHFMGEITINYADHGTKWLHKSPLATVANDSFHGATGGTGGGLCRGSDNPYGDCGGTVSVTQIKITASPKIRFVGLSDSLMGLEPWIIPGGFSLNVISPPSNGVTVTAPGVQWGGGFDYTLYKSITVGAEGIYNMVRDSNLDGTRISGYEVGGTVGFKF